jgi:hypothetical protein
MPNSPSPPDYKRTLQRFYYRGFCLQPQDSLPENTAAWLRNMRTYQDGTVEPRYGLDLLTDAAFAAAPHSIFRLNDTTEFAGGADARRLVGAGTGLFGGTPGTDIYSLVDPAVYSGNPMTAVAASPVNSPRPFLYIADADRLRKVNSSFNDYPWGIAQPITPPALALAAPEVTFLEPVTSGLWTTYGGDVTPLAPTLAPVISRVSTTVTQLLYDAGVTGMASVSLVSFENVTMGATLEVGAAPETVIVHEILPPVSPTTIAAIIYDSGTTGLCTIQPTGSFSVGQIEAALPLEVERRYRDLNEPIPTRVTLTRTVDFPVNCLVLLGGVEVVRILSVAIGPDGVQSFRCFTNGTFAATDTITGVPSFRAYFTTTKLVGDPVVASAYQITLTPASATAPSVGGVQGSFTGSSRNWALVGTRAAQSADIIRFGLKVSKLGNVEMVRLVLDLSPIGPEFLRDYLFYEWRAADLVSAIQSTSEVATGLVSDAQQAAVERGATDELYSDQYGQQPLAGERYVIGSDGVRRVAPRSTGAVGKAISLTQIAADAPVNTGGGIVRQLALGNDAWMTLECRVGDLIRVGSDVTLTMGDMLNAAIYIQENGSVDPLTIEISDAYLIGGYGPDVGATLPPYTYRYSYRSTITGERSNPSPPARAGITPRRGRVLLDLAPSVDPQTDVIDIWRFGGALARWEYVGTTPNDAAASPFVNSFSDDMADAKIDGGERIRPNWFQPWPTSDLPRSGTCTVAGTAVTWVSGDLFDVRWAADSLIIINGVATQLYTSPTSATALSVVDNVGSGTAVPFSLPSPTLLAQPLPYVWGGTINGVWFHFACGDPANPGILHWTHGNDPDATSDRNTLVVSSASEPLLNGWIDDGIAYVFSTQQLYRILPTFGDPLTPFQVDATNCSKGLWSPWAFAPDPDGGAFFVTQEGVHHTAGGSDAINIMGDLRPLFPQDGTEAQAIRSMNPVDFTQSTRLRLAIVGRYLYFDYLDILGDGCTLVYDRMLKGWISYDRYLETGDPLTPIGVTVRESEPGPQVYDHILGTEDGNLHQYTNEKITDALDSINWAIWTPWSHGDDPRAWKQWGDGILDFNPGGSVDGVQVTPVITNGNTALTPVIIGAGGTVRDTYIVELESGEGIYSRNCGFLIEGACQACDIQRPIFYLWETSWSWKQISTGRRATDWDDLGYKGAKFVQGVVLRANTFNQAKTLLVQYDGPNAAPQTAITLTISHNGERQIAYPLSSAGWTPFIAELVRLHTEDDIEWNLLDWRFVWEPAPELATQWETQYTTFGAPGFLDVHDGIVAYQSTADVNWFIEYQDGSSATYVLAASAGLYRRIRQITQAQKGKAVRFRWTSDEPFRLFKSDCAVRIQPWGFPGGYTTVNPFGGPHSVDGAGI